MAIQALVIIKALAPYVAQIAAAAIPAFTSKSEAVKVDPVVTKQIEELQTAATQNAQSIHTLAEQLQQAIQGIEIATVQAKKQVSTFKTLLFVSLGLSIVAVSLCLYLLITKA